MFQIAAADDLKIALLLLLHHQKGIWNSSILADQGQRASLLSVEAPAMLPQIAPSSQLFQVSDIEVKIAPCLVLSRPHWNSDMMLNISKFS